ncbi:16S rRNA (uracil(1498)-N(3))-methyltransferase [Leptospira idonii]|uniref:Ribosomal RNA small subunit methyltransferase E n=1 Tax=Leptospira idonii TaxID=1193500 RepID=A0A4R9LXJ0_9LEPT|nr:RsmE family RNA methyltransferase [Leptospira idonii]TGN18125.1 16S rRNA (uracil(1498)-N(3))-methyltransferase [Leptospira idonii]
MKGSDLLLFRENFEFSPNIRLTTEELSHLKALRLDKESCLVEIRDGKGLSFLYDFIPGKKDITFVAKQELILPIRPKKIAIALPKGNRLDFFIGKATEIGITEVVFCVFRHSIRKEFNLERAKKIVKEAASQSKQNFLLELSIEESLTWMEKHREKIAVLDPYSNVSYKVGDFRDRIPLIGPEGGFHSDEIAWMEKEKIPRFRLEGGVLRTETAGIVAASLLAYSE